MPELAIVTCRDLPDWEVDDTPLLEELRRLGADYRLVPWDDPGTDWSDFGAALIRTTWDYADRIEDFLAWSKMAAEQTRLFNGPEVLEWNLDKIYLRDLEQRGIRITDSVFADRGQPIDLRALCEERSWKKAFLKPTVGASARETLPVEFDDDSLAKGQAHLDRLLREEGMIIQPFLSAVLDEGEFSIVFVDGKATHGVRKVPVPGDYRVQDDYGASDMPWAYEAGDLEFATRTLDACVDTLGIEASKLLYGRVDFLRADDGALRINEVELVEPSMFFRHGPGAAEKLARAFADRAA
ncbi:MAG: hypothetical protein AAF196_00170 [Planctomycetota bacterium]